MSLNFNERRSHCIMVISQGLRPATPNWVGGGGLLEIPDVLNRGVRIKIGPLPLPRPSEWSALVSIYQTDMTSFSEDMSTQILPPLYSNPNLCPNPNSNRN